MLSAAAVSLPLGCDAQIEGQPIRTSVIFGEVGLAAGQFSYPRAMDAWDDSLIIIDKSARLQRLDARTGAYLGGFRMPRWELGKPTGVTVGPSPFDPATPVVYVADTHYHRVAVYPIPDDPDADPKATREPELVFGEYGTDLGQFVYVTDVALLADESGAVERIYVSEYGGNDRITVFEIEDQQIMPRFSVGRFGDGKGVLGSREIEFQRPQAIEVDHARRELIVLDDCNHRIARLTLDGELIAWIGDDPGEAEFLNPQGMTLLEGGRVLVAEFTANRVQVVDLESGASLGSFGVSGRGEGELANPWAVAMIADSAFVLDSGNNRVQGFRLDAQRLDPPWFGLRSLTSTGGQP
ncbi:MAG: hypothetical protein D6695_09310 [Planctomycetota bacterium]|nr:MAG: hypothetical protein D6695_09310 [Planctomycetota bacterium]